MYGIFRVFVFRIFYLYLVVVVVVRDLAVMLMVNTIEKFSNNLHEN